MSRLPPGNVTADTPLSWEVIDGSRRELFGAFCTQESSVRSSGSDVPEGIKRARLARSEVSTAAAA